MKKKYLTLFIFCTFFVFSLKQNAQENKGNVLIINMKGHWESPLWTENLKKELESSKENEVIGQNLILENEKVKIWRVSLNPRESVPFHRHNKPYFYTSITKGRSRSFYDNGEILEIEHEKDEIKYFEDISRDNYFIHNLENIGDTMLFFIVVEFI